MTVVSDIWPTVNLELRVTHSGTVRGESCQRCGHWLTFRGFRITDGSPSWENTCYVYYCGACKFIVRSYVMKGLNEF